MHVIVNQPEVHPQFFTHTLSQTNGQADGRGDSSVSIKEAHAKSIFTCG